MIDAETRSLLTDALTPPPGHRFDTGVATSYSLDLVALLSLPLHLSWLASGEERADEVDPIRMIEALRRTADRLTVFCERGRMLVPRAPNPLLALLEGMVHEATAPHGGAFHPKVWLLRFVPTDDRQQAHLRLLVMSRNLTDDASWDLCLRLDGTPGNRLLPNNRPLADFLRAITARSSKQITAERKAGISGLIEDARRCDWELPQGFDEIRFHALGLGAKPAAWRPKHPDDWWDELGVISPFVGGEALAALAKSTKSARFLVSRAEELDSLLNGLNVPVPARQQADAIDLLPDGFSRVMVMQEQAESGDDGDHALGRLRGLHAKVYVARRAWETHLFIGSANATDAALVRGYNVEFMVELIGKHTKVGKPESWLGENGLQSLLSDYKFSPPTVAEETLAVRERLKDLHRRLSQLPLEIACVAKGENWTLHLSGLQGFDAGDAIVRVWPLSLNPDRAVVFTGTPVETSLIIGVVGTHEITSLTGFVLSIGEDVLRFGLDIPLRDAPAGRDLDILRLLLKNRDGFARYLALLLGESEAVNGADGDTAGAGAGWWAQAQSDGMPLFEMLARAYAREPERLSQVAEVIERLRSEPGAEADSLIPPAFLSIWRSFADAIGREGAR